MLSKMLNRHAGVALRRAFSTGLRENVPAAGAVVPPIATEAKASELGYDKVSGSSAASEHNSNANLQPWQMFDMTKKDHAGLVKQTPNLLGVSFCNHEEYKPIVPKYWTGKPAVPYEEFTIDGSKFDFTKIMQKNAEGGWELNRNCKDAELLKAEMEHLFQTRGFFVVKNTGLTEIDPTGSCQGLVTDLITEDVSRYSGGSNFRGHLAPNVYDTGAPLTATLQYHHEMAYVADSVQYITFMGIKCPKSCNSATFISENVGATEEFLNSACGQKAKEKGLCYVRKLPDLEHFKANDTDPRIVYNFWQTSFEAETPEEAEASARAKGLEVEWVDSPIFGRYMLTKFYVSAFEYDPFNKKNQLYASIADNHEWFDSWPGVMDLAPHERPLALWFGDDEPMTRAERQKFVDVYDNNGIPINWENGDVALICNYRTAHGRPSIYLQPGEERVLGVKLGKGYTRQGDIPEGW